MLKKGKKKYEDLKLNGKVVNIFSPFFSLFQSFFLLCRTRPQWEKKNRHKNHKKLFIILVVFTAIISQLSFLPVMHLYSLVFPRYRYFGVHLENGCLQAMSDTPEVPKGTCTFINGGSDIYLCLQTTDGFISEDDRYSTILAVILGDIDGNIHLQGSRIKIKLNIYIYKILDTQKERSRSQSLFPLPCWNKEPGRGKGMPESKIYYPLLP